MSSSHQGPNGWRVPPKSGDNSDDPSPVCEATDQSDHPNQPGHSTDSGNNIDLTNLLKGVNIDLSLPISTSSSSGEAEGGGLINVDTGGDGNGLAVLSFNGEADALINVAGHGVEGGAMLDVGSLINAAVLDIGGTSGMESLGHCEAYDGNVPLAGDLSSALGATLDHLTMSSSLFDVPALDILCVDGLDT